MKPRFYHYWAAHLPAVLAQLGGVVLVSGVSVACAPIFHESISFLSLAEFALAIAASYALGALITVMFLGRLIYPLISRLAGAPFKPNDWVVVLRGRRNGKMAEIYEIWSERSEIRLRLSDDECASAADVYSYHEVLKVKPPNQALEPTTLAVTIPAAQEVAPAKVVAHL